MSCDVKSHSMDPVFNSLWVYREQFQYHSCVVQSCNRQKDIQNENNETN